MKKIQASTRRKYNIGETLEEEKEEYIIKQNTEENNNELKVSSDEPKTESENDANII